MHWSVLVATARVNLQELGSAIVLTKEDCTYLSSFQQPARMFAYILSSMYPGCKSADIKNRKGESAAEAPLTTLSEVVHIVSKCLSFPLRSQIRVI